MSIPTCFVSRTRFSGKVSHKVLVLTLFSQFTLLDMTRKYEYGATRAVHWRAEMETLTIASAHLDFLLPGTGNALLDIHPVLSELGGS